MSAPPAQRLSVLVGTVFFLSGFSGLAYQVSWQRLLTVHTGVGPVSIALIVSVYMLGLGLGSFIGARLADRVRRPLWLYGVVQLGLGLCGFASGTAIDVLGSTAATAPTPVLFALAFAVFAVPTMLMGMALPLLTRIVIRLTGDFLFSVSRLYALNTLGAASGALVTGYVLVSWLGLYGSINLAASVDIAVACAVFLAASRVTPESQLRPEARDVPASQETLGRLAYVLVFAAGFVAIGYEVVWYRVIGVLVKDSPYAFSSVLAIYLLGTGAGSLAVHGWLRRQPGRTSRDAFFSLQFLIGLTVLATFAGFYNLTRFEPFSRFVALSFQADVHPNLAILTGAPAPGSLGNLFVLLDVFLWPIAFMLVPTVLMGASFPLVTVLALRRPGREGATVGATYGFVVLGNVAGGLATGLVLLPVVGTEVTVLTFGCVGLLFGALPRRTERGRFAAWARVLGVAALALGSGIVFPRAGQLYLAMHVPPFTPFQAHVTEGRDAVVVTYESGERIRNYINGQGHGYRPGAFFQAEAIEALSSAPSAASVLVVGLGAGSMVDEALLDPRVRRVTVVELCSSAVANLRPLPALASTFSDSRLRLIVDDGRRFLERSADRYDLILMDPLRTTTAYSNNLHSRQFFALARSRLTDNGVLLVGGLDGSAVIARTLLAEFTFVRAYPNFCLAGRSPVVRDQRRFELALGRFSAAAQATIRGVASGGLEGPALESATAGWPLNEDGHPASEYYLALLWLQRRPG